MVKKIILFLIYLFFYNLFLNADNNYIASNEINIYDDYENRKIIGKLKKNDSCEIINFITEVFNVNNNYGCWLKIKTNNLVGWVFSYDLKINNQTDINNDILGFWSYSYYFDLVNQLNLSIIIDREKNTNNDLKDMPVKEFLYYYNPFRLVINNSILCYSSGMGGEILLIDNIKKISNFHYLIGGFDGLYKIAGKKLLGNRTEKLLIEIIYENNKLSIKNLWGNEENNLVKFNKNDEEKIFNGINKLVEKYNNSEIVFLTPKIDNLRLRESFSSDSKIIRNFNKGEILELIEKGKEETINGVKGTWVKMKTEKGEIGWCFDAYLEEVK